MFVGAGFFLGNLPAVKHNFTLVVLGIVVVRPPPQPLQRTRTACLQLGMHRMWVCWSVLRVIFAMRATSSCTLQAAEYPVTSSVLAGGPLYLLSCRPHCIIKRVSVSQSCAGVCNANPI